MIVYDLEIQKAIPHGERLDGIEYCEGWDDHENMGIACICAYDYGTNRYRVFSEGNLDGFRKLCGERKSLAGFNNIGFDNEVLACNGIQIPDDWCYDLLREIWDAIDQIGPFESKKGTGLDNVAKANGWTGKTGHGAKTPVWYQRGQIGRVIDYCLEDVRLTKELIDKVKESGKLNDPRDPSQTLSIRI